MAARGIVRSRNLPDGGSVVPSKVFLTRSISIYYQYHCSVLPLPYSVSFLVSSFLSRLTVRLESRSTNGAACVRDKMSSARGREEEEVRKEQGKAQYVRCTVGRSIPACRRFRTTMSSGLCLHRSVLSSTAVVSVLEQSCRWGGIQSRSNGVYMAPDIYMQEILLRYSQLASGCSIHGACIVLVRIPGRTRHSFDFLLSDRTSKFTDQRPAI